MPTPTETRPGFAAALRHLGRQQQFRKLLAVRVAAQLSDGLFQVGLASFVLFSPNRQPDAWSIVAVFAVTLLPFSVLGPFVAVLIDRFSRRQVLVITDGLRVLVVTGLAVLVGSGAGLDAAFYVLVLVAMSLNRLFLATLAASLPHTIAANEYLLANSVIPIVGPAGAVLGGGLGVAIRLAGSSWGSPSTVDALIFGLAAAGFAVSVLLVMRFDRRALGPDTGRTINAKDVATGLGAALTHLRQRPAAGLALLTIFGHRLSYGMLTVMIILLFRTYFNEVSDVAIALAQLGTYAGATAIGFLLASPLTPLLASRGRVRATMIIALVGSAGFQLLPGSILQPLPLLITGFLLGLTAQILKICVDTVVQANVDDDMRGRVFVVYDMIINVATVGSAALAAWLLPANGYSLALTIVMAVAYLVVALGFATASASARVKSVTHGIAEQDESQGGKR